MEIKIKLPDSFNTFKDGNIKFVPVNNISPEHYLVKNWVFAFDEKYMDSSIDVLLDSEVEASYIRASLEANLADAMARVAELNGVSVNELQHLFPAVLRMLKADETK